MTLIPGLENLRGRVLRRKARRIAVNRPIGGRLDRSIGIDGLAEHVEDPPERAFADGNRNRAARVDDGLTAYQSVGRTHRQTANLIVTEFVLHLEHQLARLHRRAAQLDAVRRRRRRMPVLLAVGAAADLHGERRIDFRQRVRRKLDVDDVPQHLDDLPGSLVCHLFPCQPASASAPPTISSISFVIAPCRALFICSVNSSMSLPALSVALLIATSCAA